MFGRIMTGFAIAGLAVVLLWRVPSSFQLAVQTLGCVAAVLLVLKSFESSRIWMALVFIAVAMSLNPVVTPGLPTAAMMAAQATGLMLFAVSAFIYRGQPRMSIASITDRTPGSESL